MPIDGLEFRSRKSDSTLLAAVEQCLPHRESFSVLSDAMWLTCKPMRSWWSFLCLELGGRVRCYHPPSGNKNVWIIPIHMPEYFRVILVVLVWEQKDITGRTWGTKGKAGWPGWEASWCKRTTQMQTLLKGVWVTASSFKSWQNLKYKRIWEGDSKEGRVGDTWVA